MSDNGSGTPLRNVDKIITEALKVWEEFGFKDMSLWETFQEDFEGFMEEDFKSASTHHIRKLRDYLRKFGVWIRKQEKYNIARALYEALLEEEPTDWTEAEIMACHLKEDFASYYIKRLLDSDFGRKTQISTTGPPPATTPSATPPAPFASPLPIPGLSVPASVNSPIYSTQPPGIAYTPAAYGMQRSGGRPATYMQLSGTGPIPAFNATLGVHKQPAAYTPISGIGAKLAAAHTQPSGTGLKPAVHTQPSATRPTFAAYMQPSGTGPTSAAYTQPSDTGPAHAVQILPSAINPPAAITTTSTGHSFLVDPPPAMTTPRTGHGNELPIFLVDPPQTMITTSTGHSKELPNLAKTYTNEAKYSGRNDSPKFNMANLWKNNLNILSKNFQVSSTGERGLCQAMKLDKTQDETDETRVGVG